VCPRKRLEGQDHCTPRALRCIARERPSIAGTTRRRPRGRTAGCTPTRLQPLRGPHRRPDLERRPPHRPGEIEDCLVRHPSVTLAAVIGIPDEVRGEAIKAFVVAESPSEALAAELKTLVRERLAAYEVPRGIEFVEELPLTTSRKIRRTNSVTAHARTRRATGTSPEPRGPAKPTACQQLVVNSSFSTSPIWIVTVEPSDFLTLTEGGSVTVRT
jgi:hypothetical protein